MLKTNLFDLFSVIALELSYDIHHTINQTILLLLVPLLRVLHCGRVSPKLSQIGHQLTERQLHYKLNSSFRFTNVCHLKSTLSQLTDE